jgi:hypothetical protein
MTAVAATCSQVADAAQNIMICAVGVSSHETGEVAHQAARRAFSLTFSITQRDTDRQPGAT